MSKERIKDFSQKASAVVGALGSLASIFVPQVAAPVALASSVLDKISQIDAEVAEETILGLTATASALESMALELEEGRSIEPSALREYANNIKVIDQSLDKFYKIVS